VHSKFLRLVAFALKANCPTKHVSLSNDFDGHAVTICNIIDNEPFGPNIGVVTIKNEMVILEANVVRNFLIYRYCDLNFGDLKAVLEGFSIVINNIPDGRGW